MARSVTASSLPVSSSSSLAPARISSRSLPPSPRLFLARAISVMNMTLHPLADDVKLTYVSKRSFTYSDGPNHGSHRHPRRTPASAGHSRRALSVAAHRRDRQHDPEHRPADAGPGAEGVHHRPAVVHRRLHADVRRAAGNGGRAGRPVRPPPGAAARPGHLRFRLGLGG